MATEVIAKFNDAKLVKVTASGPSSYSSGGFSVTVDAEHVIDAFAAQSDSGYLVEIAGISGNTVTLKVYEFNYPATASGPAAEVSDGTDLSGVTFTFRAVVP